MPTPHDWKFDGKPHKVYYCKLRKINIFIYCYFPGGTPAVRFDLFKKAAEFYAQETSCDINEVQIEHITKSRRLLKSHIVYGISDQEPITDVIELDDVLNFIWNG